MELVALSQVVDKLDFAIDVPHTSIAKEDLKKTGVGQFTKEHHDFIDRLTLLPADTQQHIEDEVVQHSIEASSSFDGGSKQLVQ
eukprot:112877-Ditylum_brightwellii.AAC.1